MFCMKYAEFDGLAIVEKTLIFSAKVVLLKMILVDQNPKFYFVLDLEFESFIYSSFALSVHIKFHFVCFFV